MSVRAENLKREGAAARCVARLEAPAGTVVRVLAGGEPVGSFDAGEEEDWVERSFDLPPSLASARTRIELFVAGGEITTYHYWCAVTPG